MSGRSSQKRTWLVLATATVMSAGGGAAAWAGVQAGSVPTSGISLSEQRPVTELEAQQRVDLARRVAELAGGIDRLGAAVLDSPVAGSRDGTPSPSVVDSVQSVQSAQSPMSPQSPASPQSPVSPPSPMTPPSPPSVQSPVSTQSPVSAPSPASVDTP